MFSDDESRARCALQYFDSNNRAEWVAVGLMLQSSGFPDAKQTWLDWSQTSEKFNERDAETVWRSFKPGRGLNIESLFFRARERGWNGRADGVLGTINSRSNGTAKPVTTKSVERSTKVYSTLEKAELAILHRIRHDEIFRGCSEFHTTNFAYHDKTESVVTAAIRVDFFDLENKPAKTFRMIHAADGGFRDGGMDGNRPLYRLPQVVEARSVIVVEGEKAADSLNQLFDSVGRSDVIATTSICGAQSPAKTDWSPLTGKAVYVWPDNDEAGEKFLSSVAGLVDGTVRVIRPDGMPEKGDAYDWLEGCGPFSDAAMPSDIIEHLQRLLNDAVPNENVDVSVEDEPLTLEYEPFPVEILPEPIRTFIASGAEAIGCDPAFISLPLLTAIGSAVGSTRSLQVTSIWLVSPVIWSVVIGESGTSKTPAFKLALRPVQDRQKMQIDAYQEKLKSWQQETRQFRKNEEQWRRSKSDGPPPVEPQPPVRERCLVKDTTLEALAPILLDNPRGLLLGRDELSAWLGGFDKYSSKSKTDAANWIETFSGNSIIVDRKGGLPKTIFVPHAYVSITGGIQPAILKTALSVEHRESGLAARLLMAYPPRRAKRWTDREIDQDALHAVTAMMGRLYELLPGVDEAGNLGPAIVQMTPAAKRMYTKFYNEHADEQSMLTGDLSAAWSKLEEYPLRLAMVIHFARFAADDPSLESGDFLDDQSLGIGIALAEWFKREAKRVYAMLDGVGSNDERGAGHDASFDAKLLQWIASHGGKTTVREVQRGCRWLQKADAAERALDGLARQGKGKWQNAPPKKDGGRPSREFVI